MTVGAAAGAATPSKVHIACFSCAVCKKSLDGKLFALKTGQLRCAECVKK